MEEDDASIFCRSEIFNSYSKETVPVDLSLNTGTQILRDDEKTALSPMYIVGYD